MMTNPAHWPKQTEEKKTLGRVLYETQLGTMGNYRPWDDKPQSEQAWCEQAARNVIEADGSARKRFWAGLAAGLSLLDSTASELLERDDKTLRRMIYAEALKRINEADQQPPKEGESLL